MHARGYTFAERGLGRFLKLAAAFQFLMALALPTWPLLGGNIDTPLGTNAVAALGLLGWLAWFSAADVRRFRGMVHLFGLASAALGAPCLALGLLDAPLPLVPIGVLYLAISAVTLLLVVGAGRGETVWVPWVPAKGKTAPERLARALCLILGAGALLVAAGHVALPDLLVTQSASPLIVVGSAHKLALLGACLLAAQSDLRRKGHYLVVFTLGNAFSLVVVVAALLGLASPTTALVAGQPVEGRTLLIVALGVDISAVLGFILLKIAMDRSVLDHTRFFTPIVFRALEAITETLIEGAQAEKVPPAQVALRTDSYLSSFPSRRLWLARLAVLSLNLMPILSGKPPIMYLSPPARRRFVDKRFKRDILRKRGLYGFLELIRFRGPVNIVEGMMRFNMQLAYLGYYSDPKVHASIGYVAFSQRPEYRHAARRPALPQLRVTTPLDLRRSGTDRLTADVVIIGSGAAGATLAEQLVAKGREVLVLEKGPYVPPEDFTEDEVDQISRLYADGALQISQSLRFTILQGSCVGGTTVVNNAVCFDTPQAVLDAWNTAAEAPAGIDEKDFHAAQKAVRDRMRIRPVTRSAKTRSPRETLNPGDSVIEDGVRAHTKRTGRKLEYEAIEANIADCLGCGYCNIGCAYGRKLSMLDEVLPAAQARSGSGLRIVSEAEVERIVTSGGSVTELRVRLRDGRLVSVVAPKTVIVSAGTIASSWLLMRSGIGGGRLPVGRHISFNMGSPLHGLWDRDLDSYAGLQISHYIRPQGESGFVMETWYNPPVAQALAMPGWLDTHFRNMQNYRRMAAIGILVGTEPTAHIRPAMLLRGAPDIVYHPTSRDMDTLVEALLLMGRIMFDGGAVSVLASTRRYRSYDSGRAVFHRGRSDNWEEGLRRLVRTEQDILLGTGHPQGGNRISRVEGKRGGAGGVVDPEFRVWGYDNLYVCDASVFPGPTTVNPQLTVMTMARYAADRIR